MYILVDFFFFPPPNFASVNVYLNDRFSFSISSDFDGSGDSSGANEDDEDFISGSGSGDTSNVHMAKLGETGSNDPKSTENYYFVTDSTPVPTPHSPTDRVDSSASSSRLLLRPFALWFSLIVACLLIV